MAKLPGLGNLKDFEHLKTLTTPENALFGTRGSRSGWRPLDDDEQSEDEDDYDDYSYLDLRPKKQTLDAVLPHSLRYLTIICEGTYLSQYEIAYNSEPGAQNLDDMTVIDCQKRACVTKTGGPNEV